MAEHYLNLLGTPQVLEAQQHYYGRSREVGLESSRDLLTDEELDFIAQRDSFYIATISSSGWPYIQHRGGPRGFLKVIETNVLAFADYGGNRQLLSTGNLAGNDRAALFLMDYARRERLKLLGHAKVLDAREHAELAQRVAGANELKKVERIFRLEVMSFDWNCSQHITPRFTEEQVREATKPLLDRIAELEARLAAAERVAG